jgi:hypothetical protein
VKPTTWIWGLAALLAWTVAGRGAAVAPEEICLNGDSWTFQPLKVPFYGYELDTPTRWQPPLRSHEFIRTALTNPANDWNHPAPVRVPMSWSSATSDPGSLAATGEFSFPAFWQYVHRGVYERSFEIPAGFAGQRIKLWFESVNFRCWVFVNGTLLRGRDETGEWTHENKHPFEVDITAVARPGLINTLRVEVHDFTASFAGAFPDEDHPLTGGTYPLGDRCDYYNKDRGWRNIDSGIIGDVMLRARSEVNVADVFVRTSVKTRAIEADITLRNESPGARTLQIRPRVVEWKSGATALEFAPIAATTLAPGEVRSLTVRQEWAGPHLWWPHDPFLYQLRIDLEEGGRRIGGAAERFGFREVEMVSSPDVDRRGFYLNGVRTRLFGESVEPTWKDGYTEGVGTSGLYLFNPDYWAALIDEAKRLNLTVLRTHRGMWIERMFEIADEKGQMMIAESTINNGNHQGGIGTLDNQRRAIRDMVVALRNHPSIVVWSLANESPYNEAWATEAKRHDTTRPMVATQTVPRNHPSPSLAAASGSYAMGLSGYEPNIYGRHDRNWVEKPMYVYEDNACYDQPGDGERLGAVQKGLTIFRGHRSSGYELISTFYTWQKLYGQPRDPAEKLLRIHWRPEETSGRGYHPDFARMPLIDPWSGRGHAQVLRPLIDYADAPAEFWRRSFSPVAVFDRAYDQRLDIEANPYVAPLGAERVLTIHNDDLIDLTTGIHVTWTVTTGDGSAILSEGEFDITVPLGGIRTRTVNLQDFGRFESVRVKYRALKSGRERFSETIRLGRSAKPALAPATAGSAGTSRIVWMDVLDPRVESRGYQRAEIPGRAGRAALVAEPVGEEDFVQFNPEVAVDGEYEVYLHIPPGFHGTQAIEIRHDTLTTTVMIDLEKSGWVRLTPAPLHMNAGSLQNAVRLQRGGTTRRSVADSLKVVPVK